MRKVIVLTFVTLDGVMQAPGGSEEDTSRGFKYGGWSVGYWDQFMDKVMIEQMEMPYDLLLGRKTIKYLPLIGLMQKKTRMQTN